MPSPHKRALNEHALQREAEQLARQLQASADAVAHRQQQAHIDGTGLDEEVFRAALRECARGLIHFWTLCGAGQHVGAAIDNSNDSIYPLRVTREHAERLRDVISGIYDWIEDAKTETNPRWARQCSDEAGLSTARSDAAFQEFLRATTKPRPARSAPRQQKGLP